MDSSIVWECPCGHMEYEDMPPQDCPKCLRVGAFNRVSDDMLEEKEAEAVLSINPDEDELSDDDDLEDEFE